MKDTLTRHFAIALTTVVLFAAGCGGAEQRKASYTRKGEEFFQQRNFAKAHVEFRNALQIDPNEPQARYNVGRAAEQLGNPREAVGQYQAAVDSDPTHLPARAALARMFLLGGLADKAMELAEPGLTQDPQNAALLTVRGGAKSRLGDLPGAFEDAQAAVKLEPGNEYAVALLASLHRQQGHDERAIEVVRAGLAELPGSVDLRIVLADLELAQKHLPEAEAQLRKVIELQPAELNHRYRLAKFHMLNKNVPAAEQTLRQAVESVSNSVEAKIMLAEMLAAHQGFGQAQAQLQAFAAKDEDDTALQLAIGRFYESQGKSAEAQTTYRAVIEQADVTADGLAARNRLAALLVKRNELARASELIEAVLEENPRDNDALIMRGNMALAEGDAATAIADLRAVLRDQPNAVPVMRALARAHVQNNELAIAEETLRAAAQANPQDRQVRMELAQLLAQSGRAAQARPILEGLVSEMPGDLAALETLVRVHATLQDWPAARATAQSILADRPDLPVGLYLLGSIDEAEGKLADAEQVYRRALEVQPDAAEPLTGLVRIAVIRKMPDKALAQVEKAIAGQPNNIIAHNLKGELLTARGDSQAAAVSFEQAISFAPHWWMPYRGLALAHLSAKRQDMAVQTLESGFKATDGAAALGNDLASLYERLGRPNDAIRVYESMIERDPRSTLVANNLAMLLVDYRSKDRASLDRARQLTEGFSNRTEPAYINTRGWVKFKLGEYQAALNLLSQAVDMAPQSAVMRYHLGMAQLRAGDAEAARENLEAAVASDQAFMGMKEAQAALEEIKRAG